MSQRGVIARQWQRARRRPAAALGIVAVILAAGVTLGLAAGRLAGSPGGTSPGSGSPGGAEGPASPVGAGATPSGPGSARSGAGPDAAIAFPLHTSGSSIVDASGRPVKLACVNWYGAESPDFVVGGLRYQPVTAIVSEIVAMGFDCVRLPWSNQLWESDPVVSGHLVAANPQFTGERARDILSSVVDDLAKAGLMVILDDHNSNAEWCCSTSDGNTLWYNSAYPQNAWLADWESVAGHFSAIPQVIGVDLRNEPRGAASWGGKAAHDWHAAAELGGNDVLSVAPRMLVFVEGTDYATDLSGVASLPVTLHETGHVVYEAHDYGFDTKVTSYDQWVSKIQSAWGYLVGKVPLWVGEFGTCNTANSCVSSLAPAQLGEWFSVFTRYLTAHNVNWGYWALNGTKSDGLSAGTSGSRIAYGQTESYGMLGPQWNSPSRSSLLGALQAAEPPCAAGQLANGTYYIRNRGSGDVIDIPAGSSHQGTGLDQWPGHDGSNQRWVVTRLSCDLYSITSAQDHESLDIKGESVTSGAKVDEYGYRGQGNQQFLVSRNSGGYYTIMNINSMDAVEVPSSSPAAGTLLDQWDVTGSPYQQWSFIGA